MSLVVINFPIIKDNYFQSSYLKLAPFQHLMTSPLRSWKNRCSQMRISSSFHPQTHLFCVIVNTAVPKGSLAICARDPIALSGATTLWRLFLSAASVPLTLRAHFHDVHNHILCQVLFVFTFCLLWGLHCCSQLPLVVGSRGCSQACVGFPLQWLLAVEL